MARYDPAIVEADSDGFSVFFPDVPGCTSGGATLQEAAENAEEALQAHLDLSAEHGEALPDPSSLDDAAIDPDIVVVSRLLVRTEVGSPPKRVNIMLPGDLLAAIDRQAERLGYSRSGLLARSARESLRRERDAARLRPVPPPKAG